MNNQSFCYWLQGYFEIVREPHLSKENLLTIRELLNNIREPLGVFNQWLVEVINFLERQDYNQEMLDIFILEIKKRLNLVFYHVIDQSYERNISLEQLVKIHSGELINDQW